MTNGAPQCGAPFAVWPELDLLTTAKASTWSR